MANYGISYVPRKGSVQSVSPGAPKTSVKPQVPPKSKALEADLKSLELFVEKLIKKHQSPEKILISDENPKIETNPELLGTLLINKKSLSLFICTDNTPNLNIWVNLLDKTITKPVEPEHIYKFDLLEAKNSAYGVALSGVILYNKEGQRLYLKSLLRDTSTRNPESLLLFTTEPILSVRLDLSRNHVCSENEILARVSCEEKYNNGAYYQLDYIFTPFVENNSSYAYYMSSLKKGSLSLRLLGEDSKLSKIEFRAGVNSRLSSKIKLLYSFKDRSGNESLKHESEEFNPVDTGLMEVSYEA